MHNETNEIRKIVQEEVGASVAHHFELLKEWMTDKFQAINERFEAQDEKMDRNFMELRGDIKRIDKNIDDNSLDILALQKEQEKIKSDIKIIKKKYA